MGQQQATEIDFEKLFDEAAVLDDDAGDSNALAGTTIHADRQTVMDQTVEQEQEAEEEAAPQVSQEQLRQVDLEPESAYTQEELDEFERQSILDEERQLQRRAREHVTRTGRPLVDPKIVEARQKRRESVQEVRTTTPEIADAVEEIVADQTQEIAERVQEQVLEVLGEQEQKIHLESVFNAVPGAYDLLYDPRQNAAFIDWIDHLPGFMSERFKRIIDNVDGEGDTDAVIGMLSDYTAFPDWREASERYLELEGQGGVSVATQPQEEQQAETRLQRRQSRAALPAAALAVKSGSTRPLPQGEQGGTGLTERDRYYSDPDIIRAADGDTLALSK